MKASDKFKACGNDRLSHDGDTYGARVHRLGSHGWGFIVYPKDDPANVAEGAVFRDAKEVACQLALDAIARLKAAEPAAPVVGEVS